MIERENERGREKRKGKDKYLLTFMKREEAGLIYQLFQVDDTQVDIWRFLVRLDISSSVHDESP